MTNEIRKLQAELEHLELEERRIYATVKEPLEKIRRRTEDTRRRLNVARVNHALATDQDEFLVTMEMLADHLRVKPVRARQILYTAKLADRVEKIEGVEGGAIRLKHVRDLLTKRRGRGAQRVDPDAVRIIEALWKQLPGMTVARLASAAGVSSSTAHKIRRALEEGRDPYGDPVEEVETEAASPPSTEEMPDNGLDHLGEEPEEVIKGFEERPGESDEDEVGQNGGANSQHAREIQTGDLGKGHTDKEIVVNATTLHHSKLTTADADVQVRLLLGALEPLDEEDLATLTQV